MKKYPAIIGLVIVMCFIFGYRNDVQARTTVSISLFYELLSPYGNWISHPDYGYGWQPAQIGPYWQPYQDGSWAWSDQGWLWVSYEPWGWATYHYGRWIFDDYYGWIWIPGVNWAPAYVTWHESPQYIGWAPLPPDSFFFIEIGISLNSYKPYRHHGYNNHYIYVQPFHFSHKNVHHYAYRPTAHGYSNYNNHGPDRYYIDRKTIGKLRRLNVVDSYQTISRNGIYVNKVKGNDYNVYRPSIVKNGNESPFKKSNYKTDNRARYSEIKSNERYKESSISYLNGKKYKNNDHSKPSTDHNLTKKRNTRVKHVDTPKQYERNYSSNLNRNNKNFKEKPEHIDSSSTVNKNKNKNYKPVNTGSITKNQSRNTQKQVNNRHINNGSYEKTTRKPKNSFRNNKHNFHAEASYKKSDYKAISNTRDQNKQKSYSHNRLHKSNKSSYGNSNSTVSRTHTKGNQSINTSHIRSFDNKSYAKNIRH